MFSLSMRSIDLKWGGGDALSALVAEQVGFEALYRSGASIAYTRLGRSDVDHPPSIWRR